MFWTVSISGGLKGLKSMKGMKSMTQKVGNNNMKQHMKGLSSMTEKEKRI